MHLICQQCVRRHCKGKSFMVGRSPFFLFCLLCAGIHASALPADVNPLLVQLSSAEFFFFLK